LRNFRRPNTIIWPQSERKETVAGVRPPHSYSDPSGKIMPISSPTMTWEAPSAPAAADASAVAARD